MVHGGGTVREHRYHNLIRTLVVAEKLTVVMEKRGVAAGIHGFRVVVDKCFFGRRRDVDVERGTAERWFKGQADGQPSYLMGGVFFMSISARIHQLRTASSKRHNFTYKFQVWLLRAPVP